MAGGVNERMPFEFRRKPKLLKQSEATGGHSLDGAAPVLLQAA